MPNHPPVRKIIPEANSKLLQETAKEFRAEVTDRGKLTEYKPSAQKLYQWIIAPLEPVLQANEIDALVFSMDSAYDLSP
jgi:CHAT domain-containing protein